MFINIEGIKVTRSKRIILDISQLIIDQRPTLLLGTNGAGKSTLLSVLGRKIKPDTGTVNSSGVVASVEQNFRPIVGFTCAEYCSYVAWLRGQPWKNARRDCANWLDFVDLSHAGRQRCESLSGGERARLAIATALNSGSDTLLLDEPSAALDPLSKQKITAIYERIVQQGQALLVSTHDSAELQHPFERVLVLHAGKIYFDGNRQDFLGLSSRPGDSPAHVLSRAFALRGGNRVT